MRSLDLIPLFFTSASSRNMMLSEMWCLLDRLTPFSNEKKILVKFFGCVWFWSIEHSQDSYTTETLSLEHKSLAKASDRHRKLVRAAGTARFPFIGKPSPIHEFHLPSHFFGTPYWRMLLPAAPLIHPALVSHQPLHGSLKDECRQEERSWFHPSSRYCTLHVNRTACP